MRHTIRPLSPDDLEAVIAIDTATGGTSRRGYFEKRLVAATENPGDYIYVGLHVDDKLAGFAFAKLVGGEFGQTGASASVDSIGVDPAHSGKGYGPKLLAEIETILRRKGVAVLMSQINWNQPKVHGFFAHAGFELAPRLVLTRNTDELVLELDETAPGTDPDGPDFSSPDGDDPNALSRDRVPCRSMQDADLAKIIKIDHALSGTDRTAYCTRKQREILHQSGVQVSLVTLQDGFVVGFIMARVDFGEFGHTSREAVMDMVGVDPMFQGQGIGQILMAKLIANLSILHVDTVRTEVNWDALGMIDYFRRTGFQPAQRLTLRKTL